MNHDNRGRLTIDAEGAWKLYASAVPAGAEVLGTVTRSAGDTGALIRYTATGIYAQLNAGAVRSLDGRKVAAAMGTAGRPAEMAGGKRVQVYLDADSLVSAARIGGGNVSEGIRRALKQADG